MGWMGVIVLHHSCDVIILSQGGFQGPPVVPEGVPGGPQLNDGELVTKEPL